MKIKITKDKIKEEILNTSDENVLLCIKNNRIIVYFYGGSYNLSYNCSYDVLIEHMVKTIKETGIADLTCEAIHKLNILSKLAG